MRFRTGESRLVMDMYKRPRAMKKRETFGQVGIV